MNEQDEYETIEVSMKDAKAAISKMESVLRLTENKDYTEIFTESYFKDEPARLVLLRGDMEVSDTQIENIDKQINSIGGVFNYLRTIVQLGRTAEKTLMDAERERELMEAEDAEEAEAA